MKLSIKKKTLKSLQDSNTLSPKMTPYIAGGDYSVGADCHTCGCHLSGKGPGQMCHIKPEPSQHSDCLIP
ncbi:hypothetical protein ACSLBF_12635 [Pseudoalteromonas sp. T1lg65]|uniref:hypothetical protein n=1 Tax=Pseudoalteromonas sp. T1lg65 TaxID=2077101 RepID=UPI003F798289